MVVRARAVLDRPEKLPGCTLITAPTGAGVIPTPVAVLKRELILRDSVATQEAIRMVTRQRCAAETLSDNRAYELNCVCCR